MNTLTPNEVYEVAVKKGMLALKRKIQNMGITEPLTMDFLHQGMSEVRLNAQEEKAYAVHECDIVVKCNNCYGQGGFAISAGDHDWWDDCETCKGTGFKPV